MNEPTISADHKSPVAHHVGVGRADDADHGYCETHPIHESIIGPLIELHRQRVDLHRAEKSLTLQIKAKCRRLCGGDKKEAAKVYASMMNGKGHDLAPMALAVSAPFIEARGIVERQRKDTEKAMTDLAKQLPAFPWIEQVRGVAALSFASIIGETGDLSNYANPAKVWKRMGLAVIQGGRQRCSKVDADLHGYSPARRSIMWNVGDCILKAQIRKVTDDDGEDTGDRTSLGEYGRIYLDRKAFERPRVDSDGHAHNRAKRYMEKRFLRDLWRAWRSTTTET